MTEKRMLNDDELNALKESIAEWEGGVIIAFQEMADFFREVLVPAIDKLAEAFAAAGIDLEKPDAFVLDSSIEGGE